MRFLLISAALGAATVLAACAPTVPDSGAGVGFVSGVGGRYTATTFPQSGDLPPPMYPHPELGCGCGKRLGDRFRCGWFVAQ